MGYDRASALPVWRLVFEPYPGLVVRARPPSVEAVAVARRVWPLLQSARPADVAEALMHLAGPFAESLVSWTLLRDGLPVPTTRRGVIELDLPFAAYLVGVWAAETTSFSEAANVITEPGSESIESTPERDDVEAALPMTVLYPEPDAALVS